MIKEKHVLVIEDNKALQSNLKKVLSSSGLKVSQAFDGEEGLEMVESKKIDLIILDLKLPEKDGFHLLRELKCGKKTKKIPVLVLTAIKSDTSEIECRGIGADDYIVKSDIDVFDVLKKVKEMIK